MSYWIPKPTGKGDPDRLQLDEKEREVLARVDGQTSVAHLELLPGMSAPIVRRILGRLVKLGAVQPEPAASRAMERQAQRPRPPTGPVQPRTPRPPTGPVQPPDEGGLTWEPAGDDVPERSAPAPAVAAASPVAAPAPESARKPEGDAELSELQVANFRRLYQTRLKQLTRDQRLSLARTATGDVLFALCHDPFPGVIETVLENPGVELGHARMIAQHHDKALGLDHLARRTQFFNDPLVQRHLLRNVQTPQGVLRRLLRAKPLVRLYKLNFSRELSEPATRAARQALRSKFQGAPAEERITLVFSTEGRCLQLLAGVPLDEAFVALFVKRTIHSMLLVQSLARHAATPPNIIRHLWKQPIVKRQMHLRRMLLKHPNCPGEYKRPGALDG